MSTPQNHRRKRLLALVAAIAAALGLALTSASAASAEAVNIPCVHKATATAHPTPNRLWGNDRIETAIAVADAGWLSSGTKASVVVLTRDDNFADALAGNALAAEKAGPLMLTSTGKLDKRVAAEMLKFLRPKSTVYLLGGPSALSPSYEAELTALGYTPKRLQGNDRFETAIAIANEINPHPHSVLVATGHNYPDALAAGAAAAGDTAGGVVVLTDSTAVPPATAAYLSGVDPSKVAVYGVGGQAVTALDSLPAFAGHFTQLAGSDRFATAVSVASNTTLFPKPTTVGLATGRNWPDALSGGAFVGFQKAPLLLTDGGLLGDGNAGWLHTHGAQLTGMSVFGGPAVVPQTAVDAAAFAAWGP